jgi:CO/xanthine dehydrogenase FAD-binding subunit
MRKFFQVMLGAALLSTAVLAQTNEETTAAINPFSLLTDAYQVKYFANLTALSGAGNVIDLTNAGTVGGNDVTDYICANIYTFDQAQELISCCYCPLSPNALASLNVETDLVATPVSLTPGIPSGVTVGLVATADYGPGTCNAAAPGFLVPGLRAWGTTVHIAGGSPFLTETAFSQVGLGFTEYFKMTSFCGFIQQNGSGYGICKSCSPAILGAAQM